MLSTLLYISLLQWLALITPGANVLLISQLAASGYRRNALYAGFGISAVALLWAVLALLGINVLFLALPHIRLALQIAGGLYLCYVGLRLWLNTNDLSRLTLTTLSAWSAFRLGFLTNALNPKSALFFGSIFAATLPSEHSLELEIALVLLVFTNAFLWHTFLALSFSRSGVQASYSRHRIAITRIAGSLVGALGLQLVMSAVREIRANLGAPTTAE
jgi:threonine efflux protein